DAALRQLSLIVGEALAKVRARAEATEPDERQRAAVLALGAALKESAHVAASSRSERAQKAVEQLLGGVVDSLGGVLAALGAQALHATGVLLSELRQDGAPGRGVLLNHRISTLARVASALQALRSATTRRELVSALGMCQPSHQRDPRPLARLRAGGAARGGGAAPGRRGHGRPLLALGAGGGAARGRAGGRGAPGAVPARGPRAGGPSAPGGRGRRGRRARGGARRGRRAGEEARPAAASAGARSGLGGSSEAPGLPRGAGGGAAGPGGGHREQALAARGAAAGGRQGLLPLARARPGAGVGGRPGAGGGDPREGAAAAGAVRCNGPDIGQRGRALCRACL
ncbi:unnamed protein product, partial [Prorocentrum cordatum]